jgi:hypothetical protein
MIAGMANFAADDLTPDGQGEDQADTDEDLRLIRRGRPVPPLDRP